MTKAMFLVTFSVAETEIITSTEKYRGEMDKL